MQPAERVREEEVGGIVHRSIFTFATCTKGRNATLNLCLLDRNPQIKRVGVVGVTNLFGMAAKTLRFSFEVKALIEMETYTV